MLHSDNLHLWNDLLPEEVRERMRTRTKERPMDHDAIRRAAEGAKRAAPGDWRARLSRHGNCGDGHSPAFVFTEGTKGTLVVHSENYDDLHSQDAICAYIAAASPTTTLALLDEIRDLRARAESAEARVRELEVPRCSQCSTEIGGNWCLTCAAQSAGEGQARLKEANRLLNERVADAEARAAAVERVAGELRSLLQDWQSFLNLPVLSEQAMAVGDRVTIAKNLFGRTGIALLAARPTTTKP